METANPRAAIEEAARAIIALDGIEALDSARAFAGRLADRVPGAQKETRIIKQALADGAAERLKEAAINRQTVVRLLAAQLEERHGYQGELAGWAVDLADRLINGENGASVQSAQETIAVEQAPPAALVAQAKPAPTDVASAQMIAIARPVSSGVQAIRAPGNVAQGLSKAGNVIVVALSLLLAIPVNIGGALYVSPVAFFDESPLNLVLATLLGSFLFTIPVATFAMLGFRGAFLVGGLIAVIVAVATKFALDSYIFRAGGYVPLALTLQVLSAGLAELLGLLWPRSGRPTHGQVLSSLIYAFLGGFAATLPWLAIASDLFSDPGFSIFALIGVLSGGLAAGLLATHVFSPALRRFFPSISTYPREEIAHVS